MRSCSFFLGWIQTVTCWKPAFRIRSLYAACLWALFAIVIVSYSVQTEVVFNKARESKVADNRPKIWHIATVPAFPGFCYAVFFALIVGYDIGKISGKIKVKFLRVSHFSISKLCAILGAGGG